MCEDNRVPELQDRSFKCWLNAMVIMHPKGRIEICNAECTFLLLDPVFTVSVKTHSVLHFSTSGWKCPNLRILLLHTKLEVAQISQLPALFEY